MTSFQRAALLQALLEGVALPASREELIDYLARQDGGYELRMEIARLQDREYAALDEVGEALAPVQPSRDGSRPQGPEPASGLPPGGDAYTDATAEPGAVREKGPRG